MYVYFTFQEYGTLGNAEAIIYPYGEKSLKHRETARNANDAKFKALRSLPDVTKQLDINYLQNFLLESYVATPSRFPTVIITGKTSAFFAWFLLI